MTRSPTRSVMVWGASSGAGKSLLTTALCRWAARQGVRVTPFKAQNMSNNARVVPGLDGGFGEIGTAQYLQALAARVAPSVDMNPVLLKPERDTASQVVVQGRVDAALTRLPWRERSAALAVAARQSFERLAGAHELIVIEGAGSPAEINLAPQDYVNLGTARWAREAGPLAALVVADIDRGGAFAHLYGTWALLPDDLKPALAGFVLNKFRGDASLLAPGPEQLQALTGVPLLGVVPMRLDHGLPDEDGVFMPASSAAGSPSGLRVAIVAWPHISNLDEFQPLAEAARLVWARGVAELDGADWIILPGSKQVSGDLAWLRAQRLDAAIARHAAAGRPVLGVCGGLQALGAVLCDPEGVDGAAHGPLPGLGLLPLATHYAAPKRLIDAPVRWAGDLASPWSALAGLQCPAYEIRCGSTQPLPGTTPAVALHDQQGQAIGWQRGNVLGVYAHGLFESAAVMRVLFGSAPRTLDESLDGLADLVEEHLGSTHLQHLLIGR
ncbi:MAG: cobyric acid synthase CobQ [Leptothrix sp. (in: Bacteria)]|nr:cobyric acid synthase CobQ [Leptothrix sp. (in: b-proteobacteria)]